MSNRPLRVGIVGGGAAGLYTALLLRNLGHTVHIFEASGRIGGRIFTHYFTNEEDQYFEAGAMRLPDAPFQKIVYDLIDHLNEEPDLPEKMHVNRIKYYLNSPGNFVYINGHRRVGDTVSTASASSTTPSDIGWDVPKGYQHLAAGDLLRDAIGPFLMELEKDFDAGFKTLLNFDHLSFRSYLQSVRDGPGWPTEVVDFVETVTAQTNQFSQSVTELVMENMDFGQESWTTIDRGMSRLPEAMAHVVGLDNITFGASVTGIAYPTGDTSGAVRITAKGFNGDLQADFDKVVLAIPPAALKMVVQRPIWSVEKEMAIRSMHFEALYKIGMRFKTRFWEKETRGGQSTTDLPIRWIVYPSNGIRENTSGVVDNNRPGVLLLYAWMTDAQTWLTLPPDDRRALAIRCLQQVYPHINVADELIETFDVAWSTKSSTGDAMFLPGQFSSRFEIARKPEGKNTDNPDIFFAGEHLSRHHTWIAGALESGLHAVRQILNKKDLSPLEPRVVRGKSNGPSGRAPDVAEDATDKDQSKTPGRSVTNSVQENKPKDIRFKFTLSHPLLCEIATTPRKGGDGQPPSQYSIPTHLGGLPGVSGTGPDVSYLPGQAGRPSGF